MTAKVIPYDAKKSRPVIDWDWLPCEVEADSIEIQVQGTRGLARLHKGYFAIFLIS